MFGGSPVAFFKRSAQIAIPRDSAQRLRLQAAEPSPAPCCRGLCASMRFRSPPWCYRSPPISFLSIYTEFVRSCISALSICTELQFNERVVRSEQCGAVADRNVRRRVNVFIQKGTKMSSIVLSASVRQNLLSLQSTADLLATTQNRLSTGKKVTSALDNPTNYFTAQSLDNRASDINNLLDGIGSGVQVLQAANTGLTSLQKLVDTAKSIANQVLQTTGGYSTKSTVTATAALGGTAANLVDGATIKAGQTIIVAAGGALPGVTV